LKKLLVVINPKAGVKSKNRLDQKIKDWLKSDFEVCFQWWESPELDITAVVKRRILDERFDVVLAAGGDGTVNRTARALINTNVVFGILPFGSGNGLARHFKIPMDAEKAAKVVLKGNWINMDSCLINEENFFCTAGTGFDAHIGKLFAVAGKRGFSTYTKIVSTEFRKYKSADYKIVIDNKEIIARAFLITIANANQYGNNVYVAPEADISDGLMNLVILKPFSLIHAPALASRIMLKRFHKASKTENFKGSKISIFRPKEGPVHFDGEPFDAGKQLDFKILPKSLKIFVP
jgi:YegS/Rv2252/BmrU family lipid kinase